MLEGFSSGGTDYLKKPFSMEELMARINNQVEIRRQTLPTRVEYKQKEFSLGSFVYNPDRMELRNAEEIIKLSNREAEIMNIFASIRIQQSTDES